jgi:hypothetical protein
MTRYYIEWRSANTPFQPFDVPSEMTEAEALDVCQEQLSAWSNAWDIIDFKVTWVETGLGIAIDATARLAKLMALRDPRTVRMNAVYSNLLYPQAYLEEIGE